MRRLVDEDAALNIVAYECGEFAGLAERIEKRIRDLPSAQPRKHGRWVPHEDEDGEHYGDDCSECGAWYVMPSEKAKFCPDCGADMRGEQHETSN